MQRKLTCNRIPLQENCIFSKHFSFGNPVLFLCLKNRAENSVTFSETNWQKYPTAFWHFDFSSPQEGNVLTIFVSCGYFSKLSYFFNNNKKETLNYCLLERGFLVFVKISATLKTHHLFCAPSKPYVAGNFLRYFNIILKNRRCCLPCLVEKRLMWFTRFNLWQMPSFCVQTNLPVLDTRRKQKFVMLQFSVKKK